jgi:hypothetical protein
MDAGVPKECNSPLAVEFSDGPHRIFSNCGMPRSASPAWQKAARDIAAHNTMEVASFGNGTQNIPGAEVITSPQGSLINGTNGITGKAGKITSRNIFFQTGSDLRGEVTLFKYFENFRQNSLISPSGSSPSRKQLYRKGMQICHIQ